MPNPKYPLLFSPLKIKKTILRNRIMATPTNLGYEDGLSAPNDMSLFYWEDKARGGAATVTLSETTISRYHGASRGVGHYITQNMEFGDRPGAQLAKVAETIRRHGAVASVQIHHAGDVTFPALINGQDPWGPNEYVREDGIHVHGMTVEDMELVAQDFAEAAAAAKGWGFDMVQVHGAHGWLLGQFQSGGTNWRKDEYGGSVENRARFPLMVVKAIRDAVGPDFLVEYRMSGDEHLKNGIVADEAAEFVTIIQDYIDIIHVSAGSYYTARQYTFPGSYQPRDTNTHLAEVVKKKTNIIVSTVGAHMEADKMEEILATGKADLIAVGRSFIADPEIVHKIEDDRLDDLRPCIRCNNCLGRKYEQKNNCDINPTSGNELFTVRTPDVKMKRKVLVIGGGPGGMQAAITASERGHETILLEKSDELGGMLKFSYLDDHKYDLTNYVDYLKRQVGKHAVDVRFNTEATKELIEEIAPYAVICCIGAEPIVPKFKGMDSLPCLHALDAYIDADKVKGDVVIVGGGLVGCETSIFLATRGHKVTVVEMQGELAPDANRIHKDSMMEVFEDPALGITALINTRCEEITAQGVKVLKDGKEEVIPAQTVVYAVGMRGLQDKAMELSQAKGVKRFFYAGDCQQPQRIKDAVHHGHYAAIDII